MKSRTPKPPIATPTEPKPPLKKRCKAWLKKHLPAIVLVTLASVIAVIFIVAITSIQPNEYSENTLRPKPPRKFYSPLTGLQVADEAATKQPVTAVMIENSPAARPQSGLKGAGVVYEAVAEGGITRFLALYQGDKPQLIGPVRSLRLYYLEWAAPYQASIAHVGGSPNALAEVRNGSHRDIDQFFNGGHYWRAADRYAPHNMYTSGQKLDELNRAKNYAESVFESFSRADGKPAAEPNATAIDINFSSPLYATHYTYDAASNTYQRSLAGAPHVDRENGQIAPHVIVALHVQTSARGGADPYEDITTSGSGKVNIFQNGTVMEATWHKDSPRSPLRLKDAQGKPVQLNRGQTWVAAVTSRGSISWQ